MKSKHIFLYGPPGVGKTNTGQVLATELNMPFIDLDHEIELATGMNIQQVFTMKGEKEFRHHENTAIQNLGDKPASVVALGGGSLLQKKNRMIVENIGNLIVLMAEEQILINRLQSDITSQPRPLLLDDFLKKFSSLMVQRRTHYESFPVHFDTSDLGPAEVAWKIKVHLGRFYLRAMAGCEVVFQSDGLQELGALFKSRGLRNPALVTDENLSNTYVQDSVSAFKREGFSPVIIKIPTGESNKSWIIVNQVWKEFIDAQLDRDSTVVALGGGMVSDLVGFAASTFMRGINWVCVPSTLLAMVDASLGGKTGLNLAGWKNIVGSYYPPKLVLSDPGLLFTLPEVEFCAGLAEVVKHAVISDPELFYFCTLGLPWVKNHVEELIKRAMAVKIKIIEEDPKEQGIRSVLNLGHTIGHALEAVSKFRIRHGEAVAIGLVKETKLGESLGVTEKGLSDEIAKLLLKLNLPVGLPKDVLREDLIRALFLDKKRINKSWVFALPEQIGSVKLVKIDDLDKVLEVL
ncbi:MAG: 3-dehydroquinate synthase [Chloroflexi bacterium]|nr:3-dehydroquinate synthase [Chloroflexota bacterium]